MEVNKEIARKNSKDKAIQKDLNEKSENMKSEYDTNKFRQGIPQESAQKKPIFEPLFSNLNLELIGRKKSSDSTSISISQIENLSQTSETSHNNSYTINSNLVFSKDFNSKEDEENSYYFFGIEKYFFNLMPEKFSEYKKSKNYLPK